MSRVIPKKAYGQHFLADTNILGVIGRLATPEPTDIVLETAALRGVSFQLSAGEIEYRVMPRRKPV